MLHNTSAQKLITILTINLLLLINLIKCNDEFDDVSLTDGANSDNNYSFDLMQDELQRHYDEVQHKLLIQDDQDDQDSSSSPASVTENVISAITSDDMKLILDGGGGSGGDDGIINNDKIITSTQKNLINNLTTLIPDYVANAGNAGLIINADKFISTNLNDTNNDNDGDNDNDNIDFDYESERSTEMNDNISITSGDSISFDMKQNVLYTEDLNGNHIKMRNLTELEASTNNNGADNDNDGDDNQNDYSQPSEIFNEPIDEPEMLIATTTSLTSPPTISAQIQTSTPTINRIKQGKQIQIEQKKLLLKKFPHERLQQYIEDPYIRKPLAAIVDPTINSLDKTISLWRNALRPNTALDIILLGINATGVSVIYNFTNTRTFLAGLNSLKESDPGNPFFGILKSTELIPYDSAIFISAATIPTDTILGQQAGIALLKKRIRLYLLWFGDTKFNDINEPKETVAGGILGKIAIRSGGEIFHMRNHDGNELEENMITLISDNYRGTQEIEIPVDTTISDLQIRIDTMMRTATLQTPTGEINLKKLMKLEFRKFLDIEKRYYEMNVQLDKINYSDTFLLKLDPEIENKRYCLAVIANLKKKNIIENNLQSLDFVLENFKERQRGGRLLTHENIEFPTDDDVELIDVQTSTKKPDVIVNNRNLNNVTKASQQAGVLQGITKIEMGIQSQVRVAPGMMAQLYFEITNLRTEPVYHNILVTDEQRFLRSLNQQRIFLPPGETTTIVVTVMVPPATPHSTVDKITFTCQGNGQASQSVDLKVISNQEKQDNTAPILNWAFGTRCDGNGYYYNEAQCSTRFWSLEITAQDYDSGILRLTSIPTGIISRIPFTVGTVEPIRATYTANCCEPRVTISVYDIAGNQRTHSIDVRDIVLTEASIAAIILGVVLLILLIIGVILLIVWCCKRRKSESRDLPTYRSQPIERTRGG